MGPIQTPPPFGEEALQLHQRLCRGDQGAPSDACLAFLDPLIGALVGRFPKTDRHLIADAVHQTLIDYLERPAMYQPGGHHPELFGFLVMAAGRDLINLIQGEKRRKKMREPWSVVEFDADGGNTPEEDDPARIVERDEDYRRAQENLARRTAGWTEVERQCLELMLQEIRPHEAYAALLGLTDRPLDQQRHEVNKMKERLLKRLRRQGSDHV